MHSIIIARATSSQTELDTLRDQLAQSERKFNDCNLDLKQKENVIQQLTVSNEDLQDRLRRRAEECDRYVCCFCSFPLYITPLLTFNISITSTLTCLLILSQVISNPPCSLQIT